MPRSEYYIKGPPSSANSWVSKQFASVTISIILIPDIHFRVSVARARSSDGPNQNQRCRQWMVEGQWIRGLKSWPRNDFAQYIHHPWKIWKTVSYRANKDRHLSLQPFLFLGDMVVSMLNCFVFQPLDQIKIFKPKGFRISVSWHGNQGIPSNFNFWMEKGMEYKTRVFRLQTLVLRGEPRF